MLAKNINVLEKKIITMKFSHRTDLNIEVGHVFKSKISFQTEIYSCGGRNFLESQNLREILVCAICRRLKKHLPPWAGWCQGCHKVWASCLSNTWMHLPPPAMERMAVVLNLKRFLRWIGENILLKSYKPRNCRPVCFLAAYGVDSGSLKK